MRFKDRPDVGLFIEKRRNKYRVMRAYPDGKLRCLKNFTTRVAANHHLETLESRKDNE